jgi:arsenical pump membrane protein
MCPSAREQQANAPWTHGTWILCGVGLIGAAVAFSVAPHQARGAAGQTWTPFVLVAGLLLLGLVAERDGLFRAVGSSFARLAGHGVVLFAGATLLIAVVTATLNLDTSVVFLTPVLIAAAQQRGAGERPLLYGSLLLANASSLFLPGSNLTNLIVVGHRPLSGGAFLALMWPAALAACLITAACVGVWFRRDLMASSTVRATVERPKGAIGILAVVVAVVLVVALRSPALPVLIVGVLAAVLRVAQRRLPFEETFNVLGAPVLLGLFGITIGLGTLGRVWSGPATLLSHGGAVGAALIAALASVVVNNLPAASLLAARTPHHAAQLLVGLDLGPNLFVTGSLAWLLWLKAAKNAGVSPSIRQASLLGLIVVPLSLAAALGALAWAGSG